MPTALEEGFETDDGTAHWYVLGPFSGSSVLDVANHDAIMEALQSFDEAVVQCVDMPYGEETSIIMVNPNCHEAVALARRLHARLLEHGVINQDEARKRYLEEMQSVWDELSLCQRITYLRQWGLTVTGALNSQPPADLTIEAMQEMMDY
jgi:hypothetical protein